MFSKKCRREQNSDEKTNPSVAPQGFCSCLSIKPLLIKFLDGSASKYKKVYRNWSSSSRRTSSKIQNWCRFKVPYLQHECDLC